MTVESKNAVVDEFAEQPAFEEVNWEDFRDHLATADKEGHRKWIYAKKPVGWFYRVRSHLSWILLGIMFAAPFVRIDGNPLLMLNIIERKFSILGQMFWPQDMVIFAFALLIFFTGIIVFTAAFGRLWCGWVCPHTIFQEMLFRKIEFRIDGDAVEQRRLDHAPWNWTKIRKRLLKHAIYFVLSFLIANTLLSYIIGSDKLLEIIADHPRNHVTGLTVLTLFTLLFHSIFARFREQACTFICPYGRLQSTLVDDNTIVVAYDHRRGEKRSHLARGQVWNQRQAQGQGDCVDCRQCIVVCPTGIDIRNGTQMECVNCTACIDACDNIMDKIRRPRGLIRYASINGIERGEKLRVSPRMILYAAILAVLIAAFLVLLFTRSEIQTTLLRAPGALFQQMPGGRIGNLYTLKLINKTSRDMDVQLRIENSEGSLRVLGREPRIPAGKLVEASVLIELDRSTLRGGTTPLEIGVYTGDRRIEKLKTVFVGPRDSIQ